jgi:hypothetical protein
MILRANQRSNPSKTRTKIISDEVYMTTPLLDTHRATLIGKSKGTIDNYLRALTKLTDWIATLPGSDGIFFANNIFAIK